MTEYTERRLEEALARVRELEDELAREREAALAGGSAFRVGCSENNSGGSFWLGASEYNALESAGFKVWRPGPGFRGRKFCLDVRAPDREIARNIAKESFRVATGFDPDAEGCNCCGQPFWFEVSEGDKPLWWEDGEE